MTLLQRLAYSGDFDVVSITEIWLNSTIFDSEILPGQRRTRWRSTDGSQARSSVFQTLWFGKRVYWAGCCRALKWSRQTSTTPLFLPSWYSTRTAPRTELFASRKLRIHLLNNTEWFQFAKIGLVKRLVCPCKHKGDMGNNFFQQLIPRPTHISGNKLDLLLSNWWLRASPHPIPATVGFHRIIIIVISFMIKQS